MRHSAPASELHRRLVTLGLTGVDAVHLHRNRIVMLTLRRRVLRLHAGYVEAPDDVLEAIVRYLRPYARRATRAAARKRFLNFPAHIHAPSRPARRTLSRPAAGDAELLERLREAHARLNHAHFGGALRSVPFRISGLMRRRLGDVSLDPVTGGVEIGISRRHARRDPWSEVEHTLLHEMIHQWQAECGLPLDHGRDFRRKAREVGVLPRAKRPWRMEPAPP